MKNKLKPIDTADKGTSKRIPCLVVDKLQVGDMLLGTRQTHYLRNVLRCVKGQNIQVLDQQNQFAIAKVTSVQKRGIHLQVDLLQHYSTSDLTWLHVAMALPKAKRADWAVEKLTELGIARLTWLHCNRSQIKPVLSPTRYERWARLMHSALNQAQGRILPRVDGPYTFSDFLEKRVEFGIIGDGNGPSLLALIMKAEFQNCTLLIGPEGGFTEQELILAESRGYHRVCFNQQVLRTESAAVVGAGIIMSQNSRQNWRESCND